MHPFDGIGRARIVINGFFWGQLATGSGQYLHGLLGALTRAETGNSYLLVVPRHAAERVPEPASARAVLRVASTPFDSLSADLSKVWFEQITLPWMCLREGADLLHVPYFGPPLFSRVPVVATVHDVIPLILPAYRGSLLVRLYMELASAAARRAAHILTDSEASLGDIKRVLRVPANRVSVAHLGVGEAYRPVTDPVRLALVRRRYGLPERYVLYLGGFDVRKRVSMLLEAYARARQTDGFPSDVRLVVAGRLPQGHTSLHPDPRPRLRSLQLEQEVALPGWIQEEDKPAVYSGAMAFVFPSAYEGFGLEVLESLSCGVPVVTADVSSLPEVAGDAGLLYRSDDVGSLAAEIVRLVTDTEIRRDLANRAITRARSFSWEKTAQETLACYSRVVNAS